MTRPRIDVCASCSSRSVARKEMIYEEGRAQASFRRTSTGPRYSVTTHGEEVRHSGLALRAAPPPPPPALPAIGCILAAGLGVAATYGLEKFLGRGLGWRGLLLAVGVWVGLVFLLGLWQALRLARHRRAYAAWQREWMCRACGYEWREQGR